MHRGEKMFNRILTYLDYVGTRGFYLGVFPTPDANVKGVLGGGSAKIIVTLDYGVVDLCATIAWPKWP